jgi:hypothetical protein
MRMQLKEPNPLNFYEARQVSVLPPHFQSINLHITLYNLEDTFIKWIKNNLKGRFYCARAITLSSENQFQQTIKIGFEEPKELSYFTLACPHLKYK